MKLHPKQFLGLEPQSNAFENAAVVILPFPYEGGISYGTGTAKAPDAVLDASCYLELYDEILRLEPHRIGIVTLEPPPIPDNPQEMVNIVYNKIRSLIHQQKFVVLLGGDHSITTGYVKALKEIHNEISVIQMDAHADLRDSYDGSPLSHACVMSRIRELTPHTLQIGIRSLSLEEAEKAEKQNLTLCIMNALREKSFNLEEALNRLPDPVFLTVDVDVFDWSVIASTGTPEPGGFFWDEGIALLQKIFAQKNVIGFDVVELSYNEHDRNSPFAVAKMIYKMIGFKFFSLEK